MKAMTKGSWREFDDPARLRPVRPESISDRANRSVRVHKTRGGKGGKTVTLITGLELDALDSKRLLKRLKVGCGTGGTVKGDLLELQGDQVDEVLELLVKEGFQPKKAGG